MNSLNTIVDRYVDFSHYLRSSEFRINTKANIFTPLRKVSSKPAENNYFPLANELKVEISKHFGLKDFVAFSSINVNNYLVLRSDNILVEKIIKNETQMRLFDRLEDMKQKAQKYHFDIEAEIEVDQNYNAVIPLIAISESPSQLICYSKPDCYSPRSFDFVQLFQYLCFFCGDDSIDDFPKAHICTLAIDLNNRMGLKVGDNATFFALHFLIIALQVSQLTSLEDRLDNLARFVDMIENEEIHKGKLNRATLFKEIFALSERNVLDLDDFFNGLRTNAEKCKLE
ncbi:hypothetical protein [Endozoicomonas sp. ONNA2]|uniref:hypothetical protein n=1 Tax=Endozoicomonas sp. ONNA2 TaxID=2828741 RepID=UPI0021491831|nr:hypothetical protein [Endozoicomonas sp. ONNA2]